MIGPPGLPKYPRKVFAFAAVRKRGRRSGRAWKWALALYVAGVFAHFGHDVAVGIADGRNPGFGEALAIDMIALVWPADLIGVLIARS
jgi:hypothetical protein